MQETFDGDGTMRLYHTGYLEIPTPDVHYGRKNADFGQGFYLTDSREFALRWARERRGEQVYVNQYALSLSGLRVRRFSRDEAWFDYIFQNRRGRPDGLADFDVIMGPIANDTLFNTFGIFTSGFLSREEALPLLLVGPEHRQIALKTERAAAQLRFLSAQILPPALLSQSWEAFQKEEAAYQEALARRMEQTLSKQREEEDIKR